jgi:hypothetical protein
VLQALLGGENMLSNNYKSSKEGGIHREELVKVSQKHVREFYEKIKKERMTVDMR